MQVDFIIVGQGIAGTVLSYVLQKQRKKIIVVENPALKSSSQIAAGIYNPITGKRLIKTWQADTLFPFMEDFYQQMESFLGGRFFYKKNIYRPFPSIEEQNTWIAQTSSPEISKYIHNHPDNNLYKDYIYNPYGGMEITGAGYIDLNTLLDLYKKHLIKEGCYQQEDFQYQDINISNGLVSWKGIEAKKIIFCEGAYNQKNPYFKWLPFRVVKGQILEIRIPNTHIDHIINSGIYLLPVGGDIYKVGATYEWRDLSWDTTEYGRHELVSKLENLLKNPFEIINQYAGVRPASVDRRPFIGLHPEHPEIGIFNGLGTKGVSLAPFYAQHFFEHLEHNKELAKEVYINRFISLYFNPD